MNDRWELDKKLEDKKALEYAIVKGRGSIWLPFTQELHQKLKQ